MDYMATQMDRQIEGAQLAYAAAIEAGNQPAFPVADYDHQTFQPATVDEAKRQLSGMSLRDYFAAKALSGFAANPSMIDSNDSKAVAYMAGCAYQVADAMLAARVKS